MRIQSLTDEAKIDLMNSGVKWFAWYPVRVSDYQVAWLEYVTRKGHLQHVGHPNKWRWKFYHTAINRTAPQERGK